MTNQINEIIDNLADKLGVAVTEIYSVLESQAKVEIFQSIFNVMLCVLVLYLCSLYVWKVFIEKDENGDSVIAKADNDDSFSIMAYTLISVGVIILAIIIVLFVFQCIATIIQCLLNPKYWALKELFSMVTGA